MKERFFNLELKKEVILISSFLSIYAIYLIFRDPDFSLLNPNNLYISQATLDNFDIAKRVSFFYKIIGGLLFLTPLIYFLFYQFKINETKLRSLTLISATTILLIISDVIGVKNTEAIHFFLTLFFTKLFFSVLEKRYKVIRIINHDKLFGIIIALSFILLSAFMFVFNNLFIINNIQWGFILIIVGLNFLVLLPKYFFNLFLKNYIHFFFPLTFIPLSIFLSSEIHLFAHFKFNSWISYKLLFVCFMVIISIFYLGWSRIYPQKQLTIQSVFKYTIFSALFSFLLFTLYTPIIEQPKELFELANPAISQMRIFSLKEIPFLDFMSSHMFSEQFYGLIYNLLYGYTNNMSFLTYKFLYEILFYVITYIFLFKLFKNRVLPLLFLVTFPFVRDLFSINLFFSIIIFFFIQKLIYKQTVQNYLYLLLLLVASCFWRLDLGVSSVFTTIIFLPLSLFINRKKININSFLKGVGLFSCLILLTLLLSILFRSTEYLATIITTTLHYISASQAHGYSLMANNFNQQFFIFHLILPLGSLLFIMISIYYLRYKQHILSDFQKFSLYSSLFLFIVFLTNFQRGLVRHNFMENSDSFLASTVYIATALFLLTFIKHLTITYRYLTFLGLSFCIIIFIKYFPVNSNQSKLETFLTSSPLLSLPTIYNNQNIRDRVISNLEFEEETYNDFKQFLDVNLLPNQTFLDFSNTPMLYYYCNRAVPSFFCQNLQNTVDEFLQKEQLKKVNPLSTPIVVYSNYPPNWWDNTDGVPNSMRQILIAEYIYENYVPYGIINNRSIWYSKSVKVEWNVDETDTLISLPKTYDYKYAAATISNFAKNHKTEHYQKVGEDKILLTQSSEYVELKIEKKLSSTKGVYINLIYDSIENNKEIKVDIFNDTTLIGTTTFKQLSNNFTYMIPLSNHYLWHSPTPKSIRISKQDAVNLSGIEFYKHIP